MGRWLEPHRSNGRVDHLDGPMLQVMRSLSGEQKLKLSNWITVNTQAEMKRQLRIDHPDWEEWRVIRAFAYWSYGAYEMDRVPEHVWRDAWIARRKREDAAAVEARSERE